MPKLISLQLLHGIKVLRDWNIISVDESWTLRHVFENVADGTDGRDEGDSWTLDTALRGLPLVCKVGLSRKGDFQRILLSLTVDDALEFGKYFRFILQGGGEGGGVAQSVSRPAPLLDTFAIMHTFGDFFVRFITQFVHCEMLDYACTAQALLSFIEIDFSNG